MAFNKIISSHSFKMKTVFDVKTFFFVVLEKLKLKIVKPICVQKRNERQHTIGHCRRCMAYV